METIQIEQVIATHSHDWKKWPDTEDRDYSSVLALRDSWSFIKNNINVVVHNRYYPVYSSYLNAKDEHLPIPFPQINNLSLPSEQVLEQQRKDLQKFSLECKSILWDHCKQCFPSVACELPSLFPDMRAFWFGDDCPGSSDIKTFPVAAYFNAAVHSMLTWDINSGALVADEYNKRGIDFTVFSPTDMSSGFSAGLDDLNFDIRVKQELIRQNKAKPDIIFVGYKCDGIRAKILGDLGQFKARRKDLEIKLYGTNMPDGILEPRWPPHPKGMGYVLAPLYANAFAGINMPVSSLFNSRLYDLWSSGVVQFIRDQWNELARVGFVAGEDFISFNDINDFATKFEEIKANPERAVEMVGRAREKAINFYSKHSWHENYTKLYHHFFGAA